MREIRNARVPDAPDRKKIRNCVIVVLLFQGITACQVVGVPELWNRPWTFINPPNINDPVQVPEGGVICTSLTGARFMSATGFFSPDCVSDIPDSTGAQVEDIVYHELNGVSMRIVITTIDTVSYWIPLPDHNWS